MSPKTRLVLLSTLAIALSFLTGALSAPFYQVISTAN